MPQRSFGRSVARAAASGGGKAYRGRPAVGWYLTMIVIVVVGVSLIVYSRQEVLHPKTAAPKSTEGPTATDNWHAAIAFDLCGKVQPNLPANSNLSATGIRTFGDGLIYIQPGVVTTGSAKPASFEGAKATLAAFVSNYPKLFLTTTALTLPSTTSYINGFTKCVTPPKGATAAQKVADAGSLRIETWASPTARGKVLPVADATRVHLTNGEMITVGFVRPSQTLPVPPSRSALITILGGATSSTTTTKAPGATGASASTSTSTPAVSKSSSPTTTT